MRSSDWSSDVCSSDLFEEQLPNLPPLRAKTRGPFERSENPHRTSTSLGLAPRLRSGRRKWDSSLSQPDAEPSRMPSRSEARHVGKAYVSTCRTHLSPYHYKTYMTPTTQHTSSI